LEALIRGYHAEKILVDVHSFGVKDLYGARPLENDPLVTVMFLSALFPPRGVALRLAYLEATHFLSHLRRVAWVFLSPRNLSRSHYMATWLEL